MKALLALVALGLAVTAGEARAADAGVAHYSIKARIDAATSQVTADVTITLPADGASAPTLVLPDRFKLTALSASGGAHTAVSHTDTPMPDLQAVKLGFDRPPRGPVKVRFTYAGPINQKGFAAVTPEAANLSALSWLPFDPGLGLRFTADATITGLPPGWVVVTAGDFSRRGDQLRLRQARPDIDLVIEAATGLKRVSLDGAELYARDLNNPQTARYRKHLSAISAYYTGLFGPMPGGRIRLVVVPTDGSDFTRRGLMVFGDASEILKRHPDAKDFDLDGEYVTHLAHEMAHNWWYGGSQQDYWLVESMAEYSNVRYLRHAMGDKLADFMVDQERQGAKDAGPVLTAGRPSQEALYDKGPLLLLDLQHRIGDAAMDRLLGLLGRDPPQRTEDFLARLRQVAGPQAARDFEARLKAS